MSVIGFDDISVLVSDISGITLESYRAEHNLEKTKSVQQQENQSTNEGRETHLIKTQNTPSVDRYGQTTLSMRGEKIAAKETILEKKVTFAGQEIILFSLDGQVWSSNKNELNDIRKCRK